MSPLNDLRKNMKKIITLITLFSIGLTCLASDEMEAEFEARFRTFIESGNVSMDALKEVWVYEDTPTKQFIGTQGNLEATISRGLDSLAIVEIYPMMAERIKKPMTIEGTEYVINLEPYKMLEIKYKNKIEGGSAGWSYVLGKSEDKLYMVGLKKQIKAE
ncbi:Unannotated [Lentimonas sp. CC19]|nr:Unannotated [Lentimonas sp. CC19]CAA6697737.1 Unannotated [Lentimonas sp. CC10]CAA7072497.1 Unannotated [Lentimonas sp. CC11]